MKRIIYILIISALCLTGCQNKAKDINIIETWKTGSLQKDFYKKDFDKPSKEDEDNEEIIWNDYAINKIHGILTVYYVNNSGNNADNYYFSYWDWTSIGVKDDFLKLYNFFTNQYGKPYKISNDNTYILFDIRESSPEYGLYTEGEHQGLSLQYSENTNTIELTWPVTLSPDDLSDTENET